MIESDIEATDLAALSKGETAVRVRVQVETRELAVAGQPVQRVPAIVREHRMDRAEHAVAADQASRDTAFDLERAWRIRPPSP